MILGFRDRANWICSQRVEEFWVWRFSGLRVKRVRAIGFTVEARKLEHGFRRISARIPYTLP